MSKAPGVIQTSPATAPLTRPNTLGCFRKIHSDNDDYYFENDDNENVSGTNLSASM